MTARCGAVVRNADLTEDEREILMLGIRAGAMAHLAWSREQR